MKNSIFILKIPSAVMITLLAMSNPTYAITMDQAASICRNDDLSYFSAVGRNSWAYNCGHISKRTYDYYMTDDNGRARLAKYYNAYYNPSSPTLRYSAPTAKGASCNLGQYTKHVICKSKIFEIPDPEPCPGRPEYPPRPVYPTPCERY